MTGDDRPYVPPRLSSGIAGLDAVLHGGWPSGGSYLIEGGPGFGKTTLCLHFLLAGAAKGERGLFVTMSESESEMREMAVGYGWNLGDVEFLDLSASQASPGTTSDYSVFSADEVELSEIVSRIREAVEKSRPERVVIDPISGIRLLAGGAHRYRQQVLGLKDFLRAQEATTLIASDLSDEPAHGFLQTAVRGVMRLKHEMGGFGDAHRYLGVTKLRQSAYQEGEHPFRIGGQGIEVFPRVGSTLPQEDVDSFDELRSGIEGLDELMQGGIRRGSATVIAGQSGVGKTTLALQFLAEAARSGARVHAFSFDETETSMLHRGDALGLAVSQLRRDGRLVIERVHATEIYPAEFALKVRTVIDDNDVRVVLIDSLSAYRAGITGEQLTHHLSQLLDYLASRHVSIFLTIESSDLKTFSVTDPFGVSYLADNVIVLRFFEAAGRVRRAINILKMRSGPHDTSIREFQLTSRGIQIGDALGEFRGVLAGTPEYIGETGGLMKAADAEPPSG